MPEPDPSTAIQTPSGAGPAAAGVPGEASPFPVPDHTLIRRVGRGAYGEVWLAHNTLGTWRAVKFIRRSSFDDDRPFERELAGIQRFEPISRSHESQLNILHVGRAEDGFYYVMELADDMSGAFASGGTSSASPQPASSSPLGTLGTHGTRPSESRAEAINPDTYTPRNLRTELHLRGRLPAAECLRLGLALTTALEHLHKHGLVHRDIKPSNIVFVNGIPKLADIGLVARAEATISFVGTEGFLPPEGPGTRQADIYSLGKVLYELSTGHDRHQFPELPTNIVELPDRAELSELNEVLLKACHRDPKERYQTAAEMHADLALLESGRSVVQMRGLERRLRFVQRAGAVVTVIAALAAGLYFWQARQTKIVRNLATEKSQLAEEKTKLAADKSSLAEGNREHLVRLRIANGVRLIDEDDPSGALLWFAQALPLVTNNPAEESIHRIRIQQVLDQTPRLLRVMTENGNVRVGAFSPDRRLAAMGTAAGRLCVWEIESGKVLWEQQNAGGLVTEVQFSRDGRRLLASSSPRQAYIVMGTPGPMFVSVLDALTGQPVFPAAEAVPGMSSNLVRSAFSPDDRWLAVAMANHVIRLLDGKTGKPIAELKGHTNWIRMLTFSADGMLLASASADQTARLWRIPSGESAIPPIMHPDIVNRVVFNPDASRLATATRGSATNRVCLVQTWDTQRGQSIGPPIKARRYVYALAFDVTTGQTLLTGDQEFTPCLWNAETHEKKLPLFTIGGGTRSWAFSPDGRSLAIGGNDGVVHVRNLQTGELLLPPLRHTGWAESVQFSPDGSRLLTTSDDGTAKVWDLRHFAEATSLRFNTDLQVAGYEEDWGRSPGPLQVPLNDGSTCLVDPASLVEVHRLVPSQTNAPPYKIAVALSGRAWVAYGGEDKESRPQVVDLWLETSNSLRHLLLPHPGLVSTATFSAEDSRLISYCTDRQIRVWKTASGELEQTFPLSEDRELVVEFHSDGRRAFAQRADDMELFDFRSQQSLCIVPHPRLPSVVERVAFDEHWTRIGMIGSQYGGVYDLQTRRSTPPLKHGEKLTGLDFSPDGQRFVTAGLGAHAKIWDSATGELLLQPFRIGRQAILFACWSADGRFIATPSEENVARVWDAATAEAVTPLFRHDGEVLFAAVTRNNRLVTLSEPNLLRAWDLKPCLLTPELISDYAKFVSGRRLNAGGALLPLKAEELAELDRSLRIRAPQLFESRRRDISAEGRVP